MLSSTVLDLAGHTPLLKLPWIDALDLHAKLEFLNPTGSVKDRAATYLIDTLLRRGEIGPRTTIVESSSGNFGVALSASCRRRGLPFVCVVDPQLSRINAALIQALGGRLEQVDELDPDGGYLPARIRRVQELERTLGDGYWVNQYANPLNAEAYYQTLGAEICGELDEIDYLFVAVGSCGTITGTSRRVKETFPHCEVIAVDIEGSVIFGGESKRRYVPGVGSSRVPPILAQARVDDVVWIGETELIDVCHRLSRDHQLLVGGSSGAVIAAIEHYFSSERKREDRRRFGRDPVVVTIFPDRGDRYVDTIYDHDWCDWLRGLDGKAAPFAPDPLRAEGRHALPR